MGDFSKLAIRIKELRTSSNMTQKEFSSFVGCTAATLSAYENGSKSPSLEIIKGIAEKCNVSIDWLCGLTDKKRLEPEIKTYKDIAVRVLELLQLNMPFPDMFYFREEHENDYTIQSLGFPNNCEFQKFMETYNDLTELLKNNKIKQHVIDTWLEGALEELDKIPILISYKESDEDAYDILNEPIDE